MGAPSATPAGSQPDAAFLPTAELPKGGLNVQGLGEHWSVNTQTGALSVSVPIATSPGRGASAAQLMLNHTNSGGRSPYGYGWGLSVPSVSRRIGRRLPRYDSTDTFGLPGFDDLVPQLENDGAGGWRVVEHQEQIGGNQFTVRRYRPRTDDTHTRIEQCIPADGGVAFWRTTDNGNVTRWFGRTVDSRISDPADPSGRRVCEWLLDEVHDDRGNVAVYEYKRENTDNVSPQPGEGHRLVPGSLPQPNRYLKRIRYANSAPDDATSTRLLVVFDYGEHDHSPAETQLWSARADAYSVYSAGFEVRTWRLCRRILVFHDFNDLGPGPQPRLVRAIELSHDTTLSRLTALRQVGYRWNGAGYDELALPPVQFAYTDPQTAPTIHDLNITSVRDGAHIHLVDLDSDGLPGVLTSTPGGWWYQPPTGDGTFAPPQPVTELPPTGPAGLAGLRDIDGTGRVAVAVESDGLAGSSVRLPDRSWDRHQPYDSRAAQDLADPRLHRSDLNGDALPDVVLTGADEISWTPSLGRQGYRSRFRIPTAATEAAGPRPPSDDSAHEWFSADMSGDGLADLVRVHAGRVDYWPNLGWGRFGQRVTMSGTLFLDHPDHVDGTRIRFADLDGSGTADLMYLGEQAITLWRNESGASWSAPETVKPTAPVGNLSDVQVLDILGAGTPALVWTTSAPGAPTARYLDLAVAGRPHQLRSILNNAGAHTTFSYDTACRQQLAARRAGQPWRATTSAATTIVARVDVSDEVSHTSHVTRYTYRDAYFDPVERELRGFAYAETFDAETIGAGVDAFDLPPVRTCEWFATGLPGETQDGVFSADLKAIRLDGPQRVGVTGGVEYQQSGRAFAGRQVRSETHVDDGLTHGPVVVSQTRIRVRQLQPHLGERPAVFRVEPLESLTAHYERTDDDPRMTHDLTLNTDDHGTPNSVVSLAYPRRTPQIDEQNQILMTWTVTDFASLDTQNAFRVSELIATHEYEITGVPVPPPGAYTPDGLSTALPAATERDFADTVTPGLAQRRLRAAVRYEYWNDTLTAALPHGQTGRRALVRRVLRFALTPNLVSTVFGALAPASLLAGEGGYAQIDSQWWASDGVRGYEPAACYQPAWHTTPFGNTADVQYDAHHLLVTRLRASTTDPLSLNTIQLGNHYVALTHDTRTDPNGVVERVDFDALGRVTKSWRRAPDGSGDPDDLPGAVYTYGADAWLNGSGPCWAHSAVRETHAAANARWHEQRLFVDGFGRIVMTKTSCEPGEAWKDDGSGGVVLVDTTPNPRWIGTGRTVFNNKGQPVEQYEPYFAVNARFDTADALVKRTVMQRRRYDPLGRLIRVDHPDGTLETTEIGPWHQTHADRNDTVLTSNWYAQRQPAGAASAAEQRAATLAAAHAKTPQVQLCDALGRFVRIRENNGADGTYETRFTLDAAGEITEVHDARGIRVGTQLRDAAGRIVRTTSIDSGTQVAVPDAAGRQIRLLTAQGHLVTSQYDLLGRPTQLLVREPASNTTRLAECSIYGETHPQAQSRMLIGQLHRRYDAAGLARAERYDLAGNLTHGVRQMLAAPAVPDWSAIATLPLSALDAATAGTLDPETFTTTGTFDALGEALEQNLADGTRITLGYHGGGLDTVTALPAGVAARQIVTNIGYDARRRRVVIAHGNGARITHDFDIASGRPTAITTRVGATLVQQLDYTHDPVGNIVQITDGAAQNVFFDGAVVAPGGTFTYDATYRLRTATGREHASLGAQPDAADPTLRPVPHPNEANALRTYTETYTYDPVGNITALAHASTTSSWTRRYQYTPGTNRLAAHKLPGDPDAGPYNGIFAYDAAGNTIQSPNISTLAWNHASRLIRTDLVGGGTVTIHYDGGGNRARKIWQRIGGLREERIYLGELELFRRYRNNVLVFERRTVRVSDGHRDAALIETVTIDTEHPGFDTAPRIRYQLTDLVGSIGVECDETGAVISYEEYHPFGTTSMWLARNAAADSAKRYRYIGKERDIETGFYLCGARYYMCWLGRWLNPDPAGLIDGVNRYSYAGNNPVSHADPTGLAGPTPDSQVWFAELEQFGIDVRATQKGRGFNEGVTEYFRRLRDLWGGPAKYDISHPPDRPFGVQAPGEISKVTLENRAINRARSAADKAFKAAERALGKIVRTAKGHWPVKVPVTGAPPPVPAVTGIQMPYASTTETMTPAMDAWKAAEASKPMQLTLPGVSTAPTPRTVPEQLTLPGVNTQPTPRGDPYGQSAQLDEWLARQGVPKDPPKPPPPATPAGTTATAATDAAKTAEVATETTTASKTAATATDAATVTKAVDTAAPAAAASTSTAATVTKDAAGVSEVTKDAATAVEVVKDTEMATAATKDATTVANITKDAESLKVATTVSEDAKALTAAKNVLPTAKTLAPAVDKAGKLTQTVNKVVKVAKPVVAVAKPVVRVVGEVAKPLGVVIAGADLVTANNNSDRLVATGDLAAGVAVYFGPVGDAFAVGYTGGGLADKGIEKASKAAFGVDLSPSNGIAHSLDAQDKLVSAIIPDDPKKPAYKNENKVAWFLIDKLGF